MSDPIKHECGIAMIRLLKPLEYYKKKYGTAFYGINKMYLLLEKQHNRGQDGAGIASIKMDVNPGTRYISRIRSNKQQPIQDIFSQITERINSLQKENPDKFEDIDWLLENAPYIGNVFLGHVRYGTFGKNSIESVHPFLRQSNWMNRNLIVAGNFNMTNSKQLFQNLVQLGQHPKEVTDTVTIMEKIGHFIDDEVEKQYQKVKSEGYSKIEATPIISERMHIARVLKEASKYWDGGYAMAGMLGHGDAFVLRDPAGIRPAYYYKDDEIIVITSERPAIQTTFNVPFEEIHELPRGEAIIIKKDGTTTIEQIREKLPKKACSFERIYFSRGSDADIYKERKQLGRLVLNQVLPIINGDLKNTVFSYIPNTAETSFLGLISAAEDFLSQKKAELILKEKNTLTAKKLESILAEHPRIEKIAIKDAKLRTFITDDDNRDDLVTHVYDVTYGVVKQGDNLVIIDDSIVRGTTLKKSIIKILDRLHPKKIIIVSSAPQIRYPDCYGIDMAKLSDFIAFRATLELLKETNQYYIVEKVYEQCKAQKGLPDTEIKNVVKQIYEPFSDEEISDKIAEMLKTEDIKADVSVVFQSIENLHKACPENLGDWYFTGDYPTTGGHRVVNDAFINFYEGNNERAY
ncbi:MAG: amidophosphoribosyltransferase [Flavobacteriaceae bacterium]|nr:amidophosphoribosyltransferase [Flavobacteriaceae bacterium]